MGADVAAATNRKNILLVTNSDGNSDRIGEWVRIDLWTFDSA
jgi:hypothetical protein